MRLKFRPNVVKKLYHKDVYMPERLIKPALQLIKTIDIGRGYAIGDHVENALNGLDSRWSHRLDYVPFSRAFNRIKHGVDVNIFEIETKDDIVTKCVVRTTYGTYSDISFVVRRGKICSAWKNRKDDAHGTLDVTKYEQDPNKPELFSEEDFADDLEFVE